jgi:hypothetical protein
MLLMFNKGLIKRKKEVRMKKFIVIALALFLAVPAITYAGSVTSRYDVTIGGYIKFDVGYMSQGVGVDYRAAGRASRSVNAQNLQDEFPATQWAGGESRLSFAIKGPDAWGAKTSAFLEGDFRGVAGTAMNYGFFTLRHAFMDFKSANTTILLGHTWQPWGLMPSFNMLAFSENHFMKGATRVPQFRVTQQLNKEFSAQFAIAATNQEFFGTSAANYIDDTNRALMPDTSLDLKYATDKCGKIGPWMLTFGLGGMYGREKVTYQTVANNWDSNDMTRWGVSFYGYIPIIPEKKGNKAGALGFTWNGFTGQGLGPMLPAYPDTTNPGGNNMPYARPADGAVGGVMGLSPEMGFATTSGVWTQLTYYLTDKFSSTALWGYQTNNLSGTYSMANAGAVRNIQNFVFNIMYDVNPAVRFGLEYTRITTAYGAVIATGEAKGSLDAIRFGAFYFF